ncbi:hypothetical protein A2U01_0058200, partial [Trifolium medium]|nr:hypothetical protein [Trifolium medium]
ILFPSVPEAHNHHIQPRSPTVGTIPFYPFRAK